VSEKGSSKHGDADKSRRHLALRRAWVAEHAPSAGSPLNGDRNTWPTASGSTVDQLREWFTTTVQPLLANCPLADIRNATELSTGYVIRIRHGRMPHPRHYAALAKLVGMEVPNEHTLKPSNFVLAAERTKCETKGIGVSRERT
jgi:hypothetical protein